MSESVFILGAGASKEAGGPLMADFLDKAEGLLRNGHAGNVKDSFELVFKGLAALQAVHSKAVLDLDNIEAVFEAFEMAGLFGRPLGPLDKNEVEKLSTALRQLIARTLERSIMFRAINDKGTSKVCPPLNYDKFSELIVDMNITKSQSVSVMTFNYDLALDYGFYWFNKQIDYGLTSGGSSNDIHLLKLHGSLNWTRCQQCNDIIPWSIEEFLKNTPWRVTVHNHGEPQFLEISSQLGNFKCIKGHTAAIDPLIVPPTWGKAQYHREIMTVWQRAAQHLSEAENIFILGYSLPTTDQFFHLLYALGTVGTTRLKRLWVFDPDPRGQVKPRYEQMLGQSAKNRFNFKQAVFRDAIGIIREELHIQSHPDSLRFSKV